MIRYISFDAWNTLLIPNKKFAELRAEYLSDTFKVTKDEAKKKYAELKRLADMMSEDLGIALSNNQIYHMLCHVFDYVGASQLVARDIESLFLNNRPEILDEAVEEIRKLVVDKNINCGVISNTNFIGGHIIEKVIHDNAGSLFVRCTFSDLIGVAKPNRKIFDHHFAPIVGTYFDTKDQLVHIGDSDVCDIIGANKYGIKAEKVVHPNQVADILRNIYDES